MYEEPELQTVELVVSPGESQPTQDALDDLLAGLGIETVTLDGNSLRVSYQPFLTSEEQIRKRLVAAGVSNIDSAPETAPRRNFFQRMVDRLAAENSSSLGTGRLDCCELNKTNRS